MKVQTVNNCTKFGNKIIVKGSRKQVAKTFAEIALSDNIFPSHVGQNWNIWSLNTKQGPFSRLKLIATGKEDFNALKKYESTIKIPHSGRVSKEDFYQFAKDTPTISAKNILNAIKNKKFDFVNLKIMD